MKYSIVPVTPLMQNCSLIWCEETMKGAAVDPGGDLDAILGCAREKGIELEKILVTHGHVDHAGGVAELAEKQGLSIEGPQPEDLFWINDMPQQATVFGLSEARVFIPDRWLEDGDATTVGKVNLQVLHCPGHTPGHVAFFEGKSRIALVGDILFKGSIGRTDFPKSDHEMLLRSIREKLWPLGDDITFIPGHGPSSTFGEERSSNPFVAD
ncbi:MAG: MBL fold metallo-hydrolase [Alphaproteobacteria bacterium]|jgi:glyoxylase-like metal-dependent hydrolase (beta-lactamase superfamily II)|nr:MBL fold metallo-hydrolase [Alphaproteobacteria bacterium]